MKRILCASLFLFCVSIYAQDQLNYETVRYFSPLDNKYFSVRVAHVGWAETYQTISQAGTSSSRQLIYMRGYVDGKWTDWEISDNSLISGLKSDHNHAMYNFSLKIW